MSDEKWASAWALFNQATELPREQRRAFVGRSSADPEVARAVIELLEEEEEAAPAAVSRTGTRVGRYLVLEHLGRGGMGEVYSARDTELDRIVALKFLSPELQGGPHLVERFIREAKAASALNHPNIVTVYEVAQSESGRAIAMELVEGRSVREVCSGASVPASEVSAWGRQIAQALAASHARGIIHRDIKPENLMVRPDGYVKVLDFGLARRVMPGGGSTLTGLYGGTLNYMSPEQIRGERPTAASDIFSLGVVLFELANGAHPFLRSSPVDTAHAIVHDAPVASSASAALLQETIAAMLEKDPERRPAAQEVERRLASSGQAPNRAPKRFRFALAAGAVVLAVTGWGWWTLWERKPATPPVNLPLRQITARASENRVTAAAVSPDGSLLAFAADGEAIQVRRMSDGSNRPVPTPDGMQVRRIAWFRDEERLLVTGVTPGRSQPGIWILSAGDGGVRPVQAVPDGDDGVPSPDGKHIAFTSADQAAIWIVESEGSGAPKQVRGGGDSSFSSLTWSPDSKRIAYQRRDYAPPRDRQVQGGASQLERNYEYRFESAEAVTGRVVASVDGIVMTSACALRDGRVLFLRWPSAEHTSGRHLWELATDPGTGRILGPPKLLRTRDDEALSSISATDDGKRVAMILLREAVNIDVAELASTPYAPAKLENVRQLTFTQRYNFPHGWTPDSQSVVFESNRNGHFDLFRQRIDRREAEPLVVSAAEKVLPQVTPDGKWVIYREKVNGVDTLRRANLDGGGRSETVPGGAGIGEFRCALRPGSRCVTRVVENDQFVFHELDAVDGKGRELARTGWSATILGDWDISPDGQMIAIPNHDPVIGKIRIVQLGGPRRDLPETTVVLKALKHLNGVVWSADGLGWYVCAHGPAGFVLSLVDLEGNSRDLAQFPGSTYAVPSPDGRRIAFPRSTPTSNVWALVDEKAGAEQPWRFIE